jgi:hypothetical protein
MASVQVAIDYVLNLEDDHVHPGCITQLRGDAGGRTRLGLAERFHPQLSEQGFYDGTAIVPSTNPLRWSPTTIDEEAGHTLAVTTYEDEYTTPLSLAELSSQDLANHILSFSVNEGTHEAVSILQRCLPGLVVDGAFGPRTLAAINAADPAELGAMYQAAESAFYRHVAENNPALAEYAKAMQNRVAA